jgi:hypothetical protein
VDQFLAFYQGNSKNNPQGVFASNILEISQTASNYKRFYTTSNFLNLGHTVEVHKSIINLEVTDYISFYDGGFRAAGQQDIIQIFAMDQLARVVEYETLTQILTITQAVSVETAKPIFHTLVMTQTVTLTVVRNFEVTQTLIIHSNCSVFVLDDGTYSIILPTLTGPNAPECTG